MSSRRRTNVHRTEAGLRTGDVIAVYRIASAPAEIESRARVLAVEQSVEMAPETIDDPAVLRDIVGEVRDIEDVGGGAFDVTIGLAAATMPPEPGQMLNMLFGNSSLHEDVRLVDAVFPAKYLAALGGPALGLAGLRRRLALPTEGARRALTATALKPQGCATDVLAKIAGRAALGGIDIVKDDHGLADQAYSPFAERVAACARAVGEANRASGGATIYAPSLSGSLDELRRQLAIARDHGVAMVLVAPMVIGLPTFRCIAREAAGHGIAILAHPSMAGAQGIAPPLLLGRIFRLLGADATIFPSYGGRFAYTADTCRAIADRAREPLGALAMCAPVPAGGITLDRVAEVLEFYGSDTILLIGGSLLAAGSDLARVARRFADRVSGYEYA